MAHPDTRAEALLGRLLALERTVLLSGQYDRLETLGREKAALIEALAATRAGVAVLQEARAGLAQNQMLLGAAREGLRAARIALDRLDAPLRTYGPDGLTGQAESADGSGGRLARRV